MWTYIKKSEIDNYIRRYPQLQEGFDDLCLYDSNDLIFLPRLFYKNFPNGVTTFAGKNEFVPLKTYFKFTKKLRDEQIPIVKCVLDLYQKNGYINGIIKARPGLGKTVLSVCIAATLGVKTMVIVDNSSLMEQWVKAFHDFTDLQPSDIGIIQQKCYSLDTPVTIAMVQSLYSKVKKDLSKHTRLIDQGKYGLIIYDEVHATSSSIKYAQVSLLFRSMNILGLSATPFQTNTAEILMHNTIGNIIYETNKYDITPEYNLHYYDSGLSGKYSFMLKKVGDYIRKKSMYNSFIIKSEEYKNIIMRLIQQRYSEGHKIMILCFTKAQVNLFSEELDNVGIEHRRYYGDEKDEIDKENTKVLVVTYSFAGKGFDFDKLSCLILATNLAGKKSLIQVIGRVLRQDKTNPNKKAVVDDLADMAFPTIFVPDIKLKKNVVTSEFSCMVNELKNGLNLNDGDEIK